MDKITSNSDDDHGMPIRLSVVMIVKNEAENLRQSLPAVVDLADEIILLDSGSSDESQAIAEQYGAKWFCNTDWQGFGIQRQRAQQFASGAWILALDADEIMTEKPRDHIRSIVQEVPTAASKVYGVRLLDSIFGHLIDSPHWRIKAHWRLYPKALAFNDNAVHESVELQGRETAVIDGFLFHQTAPTPEFWLQKRLSYAITWAADRTAKGKRVSFLGVCLRSGWAFWKQYLFDGRFLQGRYGYLYARMFSQYTFNKYLMLYEQSSPRGQWW